MYAITKLTKAFTLIEMVLVVGILGMIISLCAPAIRDSLESGRVQQALAHSRILEAAKDSYRMGHPFSTGTITSGALNPYLPMGYKTTDANWNLTPWGTTYDNILNLDAPVSFTHLGTVYYSNRNE